MKPRLYGSCAIYFPHDIVEVVTKNTWTLCAFFGGGGSKYFAIRQQGNVLQGACKCAHLPRCYVLTTGVFESRNWERLDNPP